MRKNCFFVIDPQNDFCDPKGSLYVPGADKDMDRLAKFIADNQKGVEGIVLTMDTHNVMDIAHPKYWVDNEGNHPAPFTTISKKEAKGRRFTTHMPNAPEKVVLEKQKMAVDYLEDLESLGKTHTIWPEHCIQGTWGQSVYANLMDTVLDWVGETGVEYLLFPKGLYPNTEHYGAFEAEVPDSNVPETTLMSQQVQNILGYLDSFENVYICGEAKSHCVANTLAQLIKLFKGTGFQDMLTRYVVVEDVMSDVTGCEDMNKEVYDEARKLGFRFVKLDEIEL